MTIYKDGIILPNGVSVSPGYDEENDEDLIEIKNPGADYRSAVLATTKSSGIFFKKSDSSKQIWSISDSFWRNCSNCSNSILKLY